MTVWPKRNPQDLSGLGTPGGGPQTGYQFKVIPPRLEQFTAWVNQSSATVAQAENGLWLTAPGVGSGGNIRALVHPVPAPPYQVTMVYRTARFNKNYLACGMTLYNGSALVVYHTYSGGALLNARLWTNATTPSTVYQELPMHLDANLAVLRIRDDGTNRIFSYSVDGVNFIQFFSHGRTTGITPTHIGMELSDENQAAPNLPVGMLVLSWDVQRG